ncbi:hypothetical protein HDU83_003401 [Entophlyctis luteolus]|nr:hypothetical protein HDU83_003401 [Entophlyctis luteolus]
MADCHFEVRLNERVLEITKQFFVARKPVACICHGIQILSAADVLAGVDATCYPACSPEVRIAGGSYKSVGAAEVVVSGNLVTSPAWPGHPALIKAFLDLLGVKITICMFCRQITRVIPPVRLPAYVRCTSSKSNIIAVSQIVRKGESLTETRLTRSSSDDRRWTVTVRKHAGSAAHGVRDQLMVMFLPKGYPESVTRGYLPYSLWQFAHSVTGTVTGTLSTQALLHALGLGAVASTGLAATTNWIIKDGFGLLGGVLYASAVATKFDAQPKRFRFLSAALIQLSTLVELVTPLLPASAFLVVASVSNVGKNIGWLASSASRAAIHRGFAGPRDNLGDITAKAGAQATLAGLVGTVAGVGVSWSASGLLAGDPAIALVAVFSPLCAFNLFCCYKSNSVVATSTLNVERGEIALQQYIRTILPNAFVYENASSTLCGTETESILSVAAVAQKESFVFSYKSIFDLMLVLEPNLLKHLSNMDVDDSTTLLSGLDGLNYRLLLSDREPEVLPRLSRFKIGPKKGNLHVCLWFLEGSTPLDHLKGFYHSCLSRQLFLDRNEINRNRQSSQSLLNRDLLSLQKEFRRAVVDTRSLAESTFSRVVERLIQQGWHVAFNHFGDKDKRIQIK